MQGTPTPKNDDGPCQGGELVRNSTEFLNLIDFLGGCQFAESFRQRVPGNVSPPAGASVVR